MCRSIQPLHNYEPPTTPDEVSAAALQYVRKISGMTRPARVNQAAFDSAVASVAAATEALLEALVATTPPRDLRRFAVRGADPRPCGRRAPPPDHPDRRRSQPLEPTVGLPLPSCCWLRERLGNPERCVAEEPVLRELSAHHEVACHFAEEVDGTAEQVQITGRSGRGARVAPAVGTSAGATGGPATPSVG
jgi:hypothetical protein